MKDSYPIADVRNRGFKSRLTLSEAKNLLLNRVRLQPIEHVMLRNHSQSLLHATLAENIIAKDPIPNFPKSLRDGYALRSADTTGASKEDPIIFTVKGELEIQKHTEIDLNEHEAIKIPTGGILPGSTDCVIKIEDTEIHQKNPLQIKISKVLKSQNYVSPRGEDYSKGTIVLPKGHRLRATDIGVLSTLGIHSIAIYKRPSLGIFSTGHEVVDHDQPLEQGQVYDSNTYVVREYAENFGWKVNQYPVIPDIKEDLRKQLLKAITENDFILISGGTAVGPRDLLPVIIAEEGELVVHGVHIKPASPATAGIIQDKIVFGLPGFPVSAIIAFLYFAVPIISKSARTEDYSFLTVPAKLLQSFKSALGRRDFLRVKLHYNNNTWTADPIMIAGSQLISSIVQADGIIEIDENTDHLEAGSMVPVQIITEWMKK